MQNKLIQFADGKKDATLAIQAMLDKGGEVKLEKGDYLISKNLLVKSNTTILADKNARFIMDGNVAKHRGDFLITNSDFENGNENITIIGGIWDGNNQGKYNTKPNLFDENGYSGTVVNFFNVKNLTLKDMTIANSVVYNTRFSKVEDFLIENISFFSEKKAFNQDGIHFGGDVRNGIVRNIKAVSKGQTNDDLIALNADDSIKRIENMDITRGAIENILIENIEAEDCHTIVRMLSVYSPIRNIKMKNIKAGFREYAINMDGARYCRTPLFKEEEYPKGCGIIENIEIENFQTHCTKRGKLFNKNKACIDWESQVKNFKMTGFVRDMEKDVDKKRPTLLVKNVVDEKLELKKDGNSTQFYLKNKTDIIKTSQEFDELLIHTNCKFE